MVTGSISTGKMYLPSKRAPSPSRGKGKPSSNSSWSSPFSTMRSSTMRRLRVGILSILFVTLCVHYFQRSSIPWGTSPNVPNVPKPIAKDGKIHWSPRPDRYPVSSYAPLPTGKPKQIPKIQTVPPKETADEKEVRLKRRDAVKESFAHSWGGYKKHAWLRDEVAPLSGKYKDTFGGWAATLVDALDTLWIMGFKGDFQIAVAAIEQIDFSTTEEKDINVFETTIRYMGGLLAAYDISGAQYPSLLKKAVEVGELVMDSFDTPNRMPITRWDWKKYVQGNAQRAPTRALVSEPGSLSLEFTRLSQLTGDPKYYDAVQRIADYFEAGQNLTRYPGLWPVSIDSQTPDFTFDTFFTMGGMSDSTYEYLPKQYMILGGLLEQPKKMYETFIEVAKQKMFFRIMNPKNDNLLVSGDIRIKGSSASPSPIVDLAPRGQHLTCFTGGMVGIGSKIFDRPQDLETAEELTQGCIWAYDSSPNGITPEIFNVMPCPTESTCEWNQSTWHSALSALYPGAATSSQIETEEGYEERIERIIKDKRLPAGFTAIDDRRYILRPEAIESVFILYRITGNKKYQEAAWRMFQAIEKVSRTEIAAAAIADITYPWDEDYVAPKEGDIVGGSNKMSVQKMRTDSMESFWLAETLKYFYLCFEDWGVVSLDEWVLNTEAHPLMRPR